MLGYFLKKLTIVLIFILFVSSFQKAESATLIESGDVSVSARVIDPNIVINTTPTSSPGAVNIFIPKIGISFRGQAYPFGKVFLLKNGKEVVNVNTDDKGYFNLILEENYESTILYTLYAQDFLSNKSLLINYPVVVYNGYITELSNIRFAPTLLVNKNNLVSGESVSFSGYSIPNQNLELVLLNNEKKIYNLLSDEKGFFSITIPLSDYKNDSYKAFVNYKNDLRLSKIIYLTVGEKKLEQENLISIKGDCNKDSQINLIDFSILAFWYKKNNPPSCADTNSDKIIDLIDFSILAFYWTN